ncbi:MAG: hypothetical protein P1S60_08345 [Anaerolineae bacterium]|nr:hypothetical protein [Anaerolineae bacterium]
MRSQKFRFQIKNHTVMLTVGLALLAGLVLFVPLNAAGEQPAPAVLQSPAAPPPLPYYLNGTVKVNNSDVMTGTVVSGWCAGTLASSVATQFGEIDDSWQSKYSLVIPSDVCSAGLPITFTLNGLPADQSTTWVSGLKERVDLTSTFAVSLSQQVTVDGSTWLEADNAASAVIAEAGSSLQWRFTVTNTSAVTVGLVLTSTVDGVTPRDLDTLCSPALPLELTPVGEVGASAACQFSDSAPVGSSSNLVTAAIQNGLWTYHASDPAYSFGYQLGLEVDKRVFDGSSWFAADAPATYPDLTIDEELLWQLAVTNTGNITASLLLTDVLDAAPVNLAAVCPSQPPVSLAPLGSPGSAYTCQLPDTVTEFTHTNTLTATVGYLDSMLTSANAAGYIGVEGKVYIFLPVVLRSPGQ